MQSPFWHYNATFDGVELIRRNAAGPQAPRGDYFMSYFGVAINPHFFPDILLPFAGQVEAETVPANWHADIAEFAAALRGVEFARDTFTMIELGCGWGCWMNLTAAVARRRGLGVNVIGVEGDPAHVRFARESLRDNGLTPDQVTVHHGIAAATAGYALFPAEDLKAWGSKPIFDATPEQRAAEVASGRYQELRMIPLDELAAAHDRIDLLHMDIQGGEADLIRESIAFLDGRVAYMLVGTHSRQIEGRIIETMLQAGWRLDIERPALYQHHLPSMIPSVDGVQGWINPRFID